MPKDDYMKYWRVIRYWIQAKYKVSSPDLDMLLFLYSEKIFDRKQFQQFEKCMSWDVPRFHRLLKEDWIHVWRKRTGRNATLYEVSHKGKAMIKTLYRKLGGQEIGESPNTNPLFKNDVSYMDRRYKYMIIEMNEFIKRQRRLSQQHP